MREDLTIPSHGDTLAGWHYPATSGDLAREHGRPCVVMAHGFGGTRDSGLEPFALGLAAAGADVLLFDYRGFGASTGEPRQVVDHRRHREDYHAAVAAARGLPGVDPDRVVLWGTSYSGGHVVAVAAEDPGVRGVISQAAATDGVRAVLQIRAYAGLGQLLRLSGLAVLDLFLGLLGRPARMIALVGPPGSLAAMTAPDAEPGYLAIAGPSFVNRMRARDLLTILLNRPVRSARRVSAPMLLVVAERDTVAPVAAVRAVAHRAGGPVRLEALDVGHFDIYVGEPFEHCLGLEVEFLRAL